jgi:hypothetical protein
MEFSCCSYYRNRAGWRNRWKGRDLDFTLHRVKIKESDADDPSGPTRLEAAGLICRLPHLRMDLEV